MRLVVTSQKPQTLNRWQRVFANCVRVSCEQGLRSTEPVDAVLMSAIFALERYGGRPGTPYAQILENQRGDGWHGLIVVPPGRPLTTDSEGNQRVRKGYEDTPPAYFAASRSFQAIEEWNKAARRKIAVLEVNLPLMNMDNPVDDSSAMYFRAALKDCFGPEGFEA